MKNRVLTVALVVASQNAMACPFCDYGGTATALFIITFLGSISLGMLALFMAHRKSGGLKNSEEVANKVFQAEGVKYE